MGGGGGGNASVKPYGQNLKKLSAAGKILIEMLILQGDVWLHYKKISG